MPKGSSIIGLVYLLQIVLTFLFTVLGFICVIKQIEIVSIGIGNVFLGFGVGNLISLIQSVIIFIVASKTKNFSNFNLAAIIIIIIYLAIGASFIILSIYLVGSGGNSYFMLGNFLMGFGAAMIFGSIFCGIIFGKIRRDPTEIYEI